jgi:uncharacterized protein YecT (DUF1311 family)
MRLLITLFTGSFLLTASVSFGASFDCKKASSEFEHLICDNAELNKFDEDLGKAYKKKRDSLSKDGKDLLKKSQRNWLKFVQGACQKGFSYDGGRDINSKGDKALCVKNWYEWRISSLLREPDIESRNALGSSILPLFEGEFGKYGETYCSSYREVDVLDRVSSFNDLMMATINFYEKRCDSDLSNLYNDGEIRVALDKVIGKRFVRATLNESFCCGAHPTSGSRDYYFDLVAGRFLSFTDIFKGNWFDGVKAEASSEFFNEWKEDYPDEIRDLIQLILDQTPPEGNGLFNWKLTEGGFEISGEWFGYAGRNMDFHDISWSSVKGHLTPLGLILSGQH